MCVLPRVHWVSTCVLNVCARGLVNVYVWAGCDALGKRVGPGCGRPGWGRACGLGVCARGLVDVRVRARALGECIQAWVRACSLAAWCVCTGWVCARVWACMGCVSAFWVGAGVLGVGLVRAWGCAHGLASGD